MKRKSIIVTAVLAVLGALIAPSAALAAPETLTDSDAANFVFNLNTLWITLAAVLVIFMQAGFAFLEIGFSRGKNAGTIVAKILVNMSVAAIMYFAIGFSLAYGEGNSFMGDFSNLFLKDIGVGGAQVAPDGTFVAVNDEGIGYSGWSDWLFQYAFVAVSLAIVWGTMIERIKFGVYILFGIVFAGIIYPIVSHWTWGGGWLSEMGVQDFAGSGVVHLCGATAGLAGLLVLGARKGKYVDGKSRAIPGHSMPLFGLACLILLVGWFGFNPGSELAADGRVGEIAAVTLLGAIGGVIGAFITSLAIQKTIDIGMVGNGLIAGLVAITAPSGYVIAWAAIPIGIIGGIIVVIGVLGFDKIRLDDPVGALSAHGLAGIWGTLSCGIFTFPGLVLDGQTEGLIYGGGFSQLWTQIVATVATFAFVFVTSYVLFLLIKVTYGVRVTEAEEDAGLDIAEHGMYGYPEQFIPASELVGSGLPGTPTHASSVLSPPPTAPAGAQA
jgi:Amt family ammonium transporter